MGIVRPVRLKQTKLGQMSCAAVYTRPTALVVTRYVMYVSSGSTIFCGLSTRTWMSRRKTSAGRKPSAVGLDGNDTSCKRHRNNVNGRAVLARFVYIKSVAPKYIKTYMCRANRIFCTDSVPNTVIGSRPFLVHSAGGHFRRHWINKSLPWAHRSAERPERRLFPRRTPRARPCSAAAGRPSQSSRRRVRLRRSSRAETAHRFRLSLAVAARLRKAGGTFQKDRRHTFFPPPPPDNNGDSKICSVISVILRP